MYVLYALRGFRPLVQNPAPPDSVQQLNANLLVNEARVHNPHGIPRFLISWPSTLGILCCYESPALRASAQRNANLLRNRNLGAQTWHIWARHSRNPGRGGRVNTPLSPRLLARKIVGRW